MTELLVGTKKGLFALEGEPGEFDWDRRAGVRGRAGRLRGARPTQRPRDGHDDLTVLRPEDVLYERRRAIGAPRRAVEQAEGVALPEGGEQALERIWVIAPGEGRAMYAGGDPGVLFQSADGGATWEINAGAVGARVAPELAAGRRRAVRALDRPVAGRPRQAAGRDLGGGRVAHRRRRALVAAGQPRADAALPARRGSPARAPPDADTALCVHRMERARRDPERMFIQFHGGVYRSDDAGQTWSEIGAGLPSDFGFPLALDPADPDSAYVIPLVGRLRPGHARRARARVRDARRR